MNVRKNLKAIQDIDDVMQTECRDQLTFTGIQSNKRAAKARQNRSTGKSWFKFSQN